MHIKRALAITAAALGFFLTIQGASAEISTKAVQDNPGSASTYVKHGGGHHGSSHAGRSHVSRGIHGRRHFRGHGGDFIIGVPFIDLDIIDGGGCYQNCRRYHGPRYCRTHAQNYCY